MNCGLTLLTHFLPPSLPGRSFLDTMCRRCTLPSETNSIPSRHPLSPTTLLPWLRPLAYSPLQYGISAPKSHNLTRCIGRLLVSAVLLSDLIPQFQDVKVSLVTSTLFLRGSLQESQKRLFFYGDDAFGTGGNPLPFLLYNKVGRTTIVRRKFVWLLPFGRRC